PAERGAREGPRCIACASLWQPSGEVIGGERRRRSDRERIERARYGPELSRGDLAAAPRPASQADLPPPGSPGAGILAARRARARARCQRLPPFAFCADADSFGTVRIASQPASSTPSFVAPVRHIEVSPSAVPRPA